MGYKRYHTPYGIPHPVTVFLKAEMVSPGCAFFCHTYAASEMINGDDEAELEGVKTPDRFRCSMYTAVGDDDGDRQRRE